MSYQRRLLEPKVAEISKKFGAVLVTGPRQSGKTWLLSHVAQELFRGEVDAVSFDTPAEVDRFRRDPELFFRNRPGVLFLDEVQHVPDIFPYLKREIDAGSGAFRFFLSGSQHFDLMKGVTESLAGRCAILDLWPLATAEARGCSSTDVVALVKGLQDPKRLEEVAGLESPCSDTHDIVPAMLTGGYPRVALWDGGADWFESYRRTYIHRDVRQLSQVADLGRFDRFVTLCAGRSGTVLNKAEMGRALGIDHKTVDHWLSLLETSYQALAIPAQHASSTKRLVRRPKWVFADSGLGLHLQGIRDEAGLLGAPHFGHLFEAFVIMELRKLWGHLGEPWDARFWRTPGGPECDLVLPVGGRLVPIEIKHTASPRDADMRGLRRFMNDHRHAPRGVLLSLHSRVEELRPQIWNLPLGLVLQGRP